MNWLVASLAGVVLYSFVNILDKIAVERYLKLPRTLIVFKAAMWLLVLAVLLFIRIELPSLGMLLLIIAAGALVALAFIPYTKAVAMEEASRIVPLTQLQSLFVLVLSLLFLGERLGAGQYVAFFLILAGGLLISAKNLKNVFSLSRALPLMAVAMLMFAGNMVIFSFVYQRVEYWSGAVLGLAASAVVGLGFLLDRPTRKDALQAVRTHGGKGKAVLAMNGLLHLVAALLINYGLKSGPASLVSVSGGLQALLVLVWGVILSKLAPSVLTEDVRAQVLAQKGIAIALLIAGLLLLSW